MATFTPATGASNPGGRLLVDASGNLFGTTLSGGAHGVWRGVRSEGRQLARQPYSPASTLAVFPLARATWSKTRRATFSAPPPTRCSKLRSQAPAMLLRLASSPSRRGQKLAFHRRLQRRHLRDNGGGGVNNAGTVFEIEKTATGYASTPTTLASFTSADGQLLLTTQNPDRRRQWQPFGTTDPSSKIPAAWCSRSSRRRLATISPRTLFDFNGIAEGSLGANVVADANGNLFGTTQAGGVNNKGSAFEITNSGYTPTQTVTPIIDNILWQKRMARRTSGKRMGTRSRRGLVSPNPGPNWKATGTGTSSDGNPDILWQHAAVGGGDLGNERQQPPRRRGGGPQSWAELESDRNWRFQP